MADRSERTYLWKGLNRMPYIADGEMRNMKNLSSDAYPFITTRKGRKPYKFDIYIDSPEGEAYKDIAMLPEPCIDEAENVYRLSESYAEDEYVSGEFYYWDGSTWVQRIKDSNFLGETDVVTTYGTTKTLISSSYYDSFSGSSYWYYMGQYWSGQPNTFFTIYNPPGTCSYYITRYRVRYTGEDNGDFKKGKYYAYKVYVEAYLSSASSYNYEHSYLVSPSIANSGGTYRYYNSNQTSNPTISYNYIKPTGETNSETFSVANGGRYMVLLRGYGYWEEIDANEYEAVSQMPKNPANGEQVLYLGTYYGAPVKAVYYTCKHTLNAAGEELYFYTKANSATSHTSVTYLPEASEENLGKCYYYSGIQKGQFAQCDCSGGGYIWVKVSHPRVKRTVTVAEYLTDYKNIELDEILEIAAFEGEIAVMFTTQSGEIKLLYDRRIYNINNMSLEPGKKFSIVGNRLVVGESGAYLHLKDNAATFFKSGSAFSRTVTASYAAYGNGGDRYKSSNIYGSASNGSATFNLWIQGKTNAGYKAVAEGLSKSGTNFSVTFNGKTYYLTSTNATYEERVFEWGVGSRVYYDYGVWLQVKATGVKEDFEWDNYDNGFSLDFTFASTDPHYYDVVPWKKRLWGYDKNILRGTVSDIFASSGIVDWVTGDNTNTEAISQPLWQGGNITGIAALIDGLVCLKHDCVTLVTGNYPAIMNSNTIPCKGLPVKNRESVAVINESVYYLSDGGVYRFDGGIPRCISRDAKITGTEAVGAGDGEKYYLSLKEPNGDYALYIYDVNRETWHKEDNTHAASFTMLNSEMYMAVGKEIYNINAPQEDVDWECELWYDEGTHRRKRYKEFHMRGNVGHCEFFLKADGGEWKFIAAQEGQFSIKIPPFECEELSVLIKGEGICEIKSLDRVFEVDG